jgi:heme exporter protein B
MPDVRSPALPPSSRREDAGRRPASGRSARAGPGSGPGRSTSLGAAALAILRKDLTVELRTRESVPAMALFSITVFVLFHFGLDRDTLEGDLAAGVLWVTLLLATVLAVNRLFVAEREQGGVDGILLAPVDRTALFLAKAAALLLYLLLLELVAVPAFGLLLAPGLGGALPELVVVLLVADLGLAAIGALVAALAAETRVRELIVPLLVLPLLVPVVIAGASAAAPLLEPPQEPDGLAGWLGFLGVYDMVFILLSVAVFDFLLED